MTWTHVPSLNTFIEEMIPICVCFVHNSFHICIIFVYVFHDH